MSASTPDTRARSAVLAGVCFIAGPTVWFLLYKIVHWHWAWSASLAIAVGIAVRTRGWRGLLLGACWFAGCVALVLLIYVIRWGELPPLPPGQTVEPVEG